MWLVGSALSKPAASNLRSRHRGARRRGRCTREAAERGRARSQGYRARSRRVGCAPLPGPPAGVAGPQAGRAAGSPPAKLAHRRAEGGPCCPRRTRRRRASRATLASLASRDPNGPQSLARARMPTRTSCVRSSRSSRSPSTLEYNAHAVFKSDSRRGQHARARAPVIARAPSARACRADAARRPPACPARAPPRRRPGC